MVVVKHIKIMEKYMATISVRIIQIVISFRTTKVNPKVTTMTSEAVGPSDSFYSQLKKIGSLIFKINVQPVFGPSYQSRE